MVPQKIHSQISLNPYLPNPFEFFDFSSSPTDATIHQLQSAFEEGKILIIHGLIPSNIDFFLDIPAAHFKEWVPPIEDRDILSLPTNEKHPLWNFYPDSALINAFREKIPLFQNSWQSLHSCLFPNYSYKNEYWSWRFNHMDLGQLHLDVPPNYPEHQMRSFMNLSRRPRLLQIGPTLVSLINKFYDRFHLNEFSHLNTKDFLQAVKVRLFKENKFEDHLLPRHTLWLAPGDIWISHSSLITHGIIYGEKTVCYECRIPTEQLKNQNGNFHKIMEKIKINKSLQGYDFPIFGQL